MLFALHLVHGHPLNNDPTILEVNDLGFIRGKEIQTVGYFNNTPKTYHSYRNIKFAQAERFKVSISLVTSSEFLLIAYFFRNLTHSMTLLEKMLQAQWTSQRTDLCALREH